MPLDHIVYEFEIYSFVEAEPQFGSLGFHCLQVPPRNSVINASIFFAEVAIEHCPFLVHGMACITFVDGSSVPVDQSDPQHCLPHVPIGSFQRADWTAAHALVSQAGLKYKLP